MSEAQTASGGTRATAAATDGYPTYRARLPWAWWTRNRRYALYMLRELSSVFIALWMTRFLIQIHRLRQGEDAFARFVAAQRRPVVVLFNVMTFLFALLHAITWLQLAGVVTEVRVGGRKAPPALITAGAFASWAAASLGVAIALMRGGRVHRA